MGVAQYERRILAHAKSVTGNAKLRMKDILEWSTAPIKEHPNEATHYLPELGVYVAVPGLTEKKPAA